MGSGAAPPPHACRPPPLGRPHDPSTGSSRRPHRRPHRLTGTAALAAAGYTAPASAAAPGEKGGLFRLTVLGTTDLHGNVYNWDYYRDAEYDDRAHNDIGLARAATLIRAMRRERRRQGGVLTLDAGDTIQGTPLAYYYARVKPITEGGRHPMARAMNLVGYDAAALGNHEFNYGIPLLRRFESQLDFPLLGANAVDDATGRPAFAPYITKTFDYAGGRGKVKVGVLGLTNPGIAIWDKANVEGRMRFPGLVEQAQHFVPRMKAAGCDVVVVAAHSGMSGNSSYGDAAPNENASVLVAEQVPDVDAVLVGHAHLEVPERIVTNTATGRDVVLCEPYYWGNRVAVMTLDLAPTGRGADRGWRVVSRSSQLLNSNTAADDPAVADALQHQHEVVVEYVNKPIGTSTEALSAARAVVEDVPIIDFVQHVQAEAVKGGLAAGDAALPVLSIAAPFSRQASFPQGQVSIRDVAGLYIYDNTLLGVRITGAQLKDYLEYSMRYFQTVTTTTADIDDVTNAVYNGSSVPDYNFDSVAGLDAPLTYDVDLAQAPDSGARVVDLAYDGVPVVGTDEFALAINNYRQSGGGGFPHVATAPIVYNEQQEIRQLLIDWATAHETIDPADFASVDWRLVSNGQPITVT